MMDFLDKAIEESFPAGETVWKGDDSAERTVLYELTDIRGDVVEIRVSKDRYLSFNLNRLLDAVVHHRRYHE